MVGTWSSPENRSCETWIFKFSGGVASVFALTLNCLSCLCGISLVSLMLYLPLSLGKIEEIIDLRVSSRSRFAVSKSCFS